MPLFAVREYDEVYHLEVDIKMKIFSFLRNALQTTKKTEKKSVSYKITLPLLFFQHKISCKEDTYVHGSRHKD